MKVYADKTQKNHTKPAKNTDLNKEISHAQAFQFVDDRSESKQIHQLQEMANNSPRVKQLSTFENRANSRQLPNQSTQLQTIQKKDRIT